MTTITLKAGSASKFFISEVFADPTIPPCVVFKRPYLVICAEEFNTRMLSEVLAAIDEKTPAGLPFLSKRKFSAQECEIGLNNSFIDGNKYKLPNIKFPLIIISPNIDKKTKVVMKTLKVRGEMNTLVIKSDEQSSFSEIKQASKGASLEEKLSYSLYGPVDFDVYCGIKKTILTDGKLDIVKNFEKSPEDLALMEQELFFEGLRKEES